MLRKILMQMPWCLVGFSLLLSGTQTARATNHFRCIDEYLDEQEGKAPALDLDISPSDVEIVVGKVMQAIGLKEKSVKDIVIYPCRFADKVFVWVAKHTSDETARNKERNKKRMALIKKHIAPDTEFIIYDPTWVREVIGRDYFQAVVLFGHELAHLLNRHFTSRADLDPKEKETEGDYFAGCAVAHLGGDRSVFENLLARLREEKSDKYPDRLKSLEAADEGFRKCEKTVVLAGVTVPALGLDAKYGMPPGQVRPVSVTVPLIGYVRVPVGYLSEGQAIQICLPTQVDNIPSTTLFRFWLVREDLNFGSQPNIGRFRAISGKCTIEGHEGILVESVADSGEKYIIVIKQAPNGIVGGFNRSMAFIGATVFDLDIVLDIRRK
ncbi:MAG: hypothetical protein AB7H90_12600 [Alphaproteobacteria bacterium]